MPYYRNVYSGIIKRAETPINVACSKCVRVFAKVPIGAHVKVYLVIDDRPEPTPAPPRPKAWRQDEGDAARRL